MPDNEKKLRCTPSNVRMNCENASRTTVRVRTSDRAKGVIISAIGYDTSRVLVDPRSATATNENGFIEVTLQCPGRGFCPANTTVTFTADAGDYEDCEVNVVCEVLPDPKTEVRDTPGEHGLASLFRSRGCSTDSPWVAAGDIHGALVAQILTDREDAKGDLRVLIRHGLEKLVGSNCLSHSEAHILAELADIVRNEDKKAAVLKCRRLHQSLLHSGASPMALVISSIACDSLVTSLALTIDVEGDIVGVVVGGVLGSLFGNPLVGAIVGAALLSAPGVAE